jgi:putative ABC transport system permease protein
MKLFQLMILAVQSLKTNHLRTMLTVLGVVVGIFSIIVIMTIITMLQNTIESGIQFLNKNSFEIQKWPAILAGDHDWQKYRNRRDITLDDFYRLENLMTDVEGMGAHEGTGGKVVRFGNRQTNPSTYVVGVTEGTYKTLNLEIEEGREIRKTDLEYSNNVCVLGNFIVDKIFYNIDPVGQIVRVDGRPFKVIGILKKQPEFFGQSQDNYIVMPITTFQSIYGKRSQSVAITVMSFSAQDYNDAMESAIGYMRIIRKVPPGEDNDFDIFSNESVISIIALIAAGVGIMNIMLVSVTERTKEIGIRKAVGAKKLNILMQFLFEAVILCLIGGFIGVAVGVGIGNLAGSYLNAESAVPYDWVLIGLSLCLFVGILFGTYPAYKAASLDPIEALRYE